MCTWVLLIRSHCKDNCGKFWFDRDRQSFVSDLKTHFAVFQCDQILAKFDHFGKYVKIFANVLNVYLVLGKVFHSLWHTLYAFGQIFIAVNGQILKTQSGHTAALLPFRKNRWRRLKIESQLQVAVFKILLNYFVATKRVSLLHLTKGWCSKNLVRSTHVEYRKVFALAYPDWVKETKNKTRNDLD